MEGTYCVYFGKQPSGKVMVMRQGLYYHFFCHCQLSGNVVCRLVVTVGNQQHKLGVPVPVKDGFELNTRIPSKRLEQGNPVFSLIPQTDIVEGTFTPIYPDEPFAYIEQLKEAFLVRKYGKAGILLK